MDNARNKVAKALHTDRSWLREFFAEFLGTAFLVALGDAAVAQMLVRARRDVLVAGSPVPISQIVQPTDFLSVNFGYAFAIAFGVYICGGVSGGHINPAVTLAMCLFGRLPWRKLPVYWLGQYFGGFVGSVLLYVTYYDSFTALGTTGGAGRLGLGPGIFATYPADHMNIFPSFLDQVVGGAILLLCVFALTDPRNAGVPKYFVPLLVGLVVGLIGMAYGIQCGYAINPARDFAPRLFALIVYGGRVFEIGNKNFGYFFWIPIVGPHLGAILGALIYQALIGIHWPPIYEERQVVITTTSHVVHEKPKEAMSNL